MSGNDNLLMNNLERALSTDINDLQSIEARVLAELFRYTFRARALGLPFVESNRNIAMGLAVSASGSDVSVSQGVLLQQSATLAPIPGALDSSYRLARLDTPTVVTGPVPGVNTWYLLEAQMVQAVVTSAVRDIYNPGTQTFAPALVPKIVAQTIQFQLVAGALGQLPLPSGGDWVPVAGVLWPAGGGAPLRIVDMRPLPDVEEGGFTLSSEAVHQRVNTATLPDTPSSDVLVGARTFNAQGRMGGTVSGVFNPTAADFVEPGTVIAANQWFYLYLASWSALGLKPQNAQPAPSAFRGVLVLSATPPVTGSLVPSAAITLPAPYGALAVSAGAVCVGAFRRNAANTGWVQSSETRGRGIVASGANAIVVNTSAAGPAASQTVAVNLSTFVPRHARSIRLRFDVDAAVVAGTPYGMTVGVRRTGDVNNAMQFGCGMFDSAEFDWPAELGDLLTYSAALTGGTANFISSLIVVGWSL